MSTTHGFVMTIPGPTVVRFDPAHDEWTASNDGLRVAAAGATEAEARERYAAAYMTRLTDRMTETVLRYTSAAPHPASCDGDCGFPVAAT